MKLLKLTMLAITATLFTSCTTKPNMEETHTQGPSKVELSYHEGQHRLFVDGRPFYVQGAGCECWDIESLALHGANSFRTWMDSESQRPGLELLDEAHSHGLKVMMGIQVGRERHGFDYNNKEAVQKQLEEIRETVIKYKDHPALLAWGIGNELNLRAENMKVWDAVDEISRMIHELDGNHPTTTMMAGIGKREVDYLNQIGSDLDFLCIQMYGDIVNLHQRLEEAGYNGPYIVTEWGATGHWEVDRTEWDVAIEQTSSEKADAIRSRYENVILKDPANCMGSYVFLWGQKQERTPTWYGLFTENGEETEAIDVMHYFWNGEWPENRVPRILEASLEDKSRYDNIILSPGSHHTANIEVMDYNGDPMQIRMEILRESSDLKDGGDLESRPARLDASIMDYTDGEIHFNAPEEEGAYRLFLYVLDGHNHAGTVNFPFLVSREKS